MKHSRPSLLGIGFIALLDAFPALRPHLWRWWYDVLARRDEAGELLLMNFGYDGESPLDLSEQEESYRYPLQLYAHLADAAGLEGKSVLEVGCGRGGGAAYLTRTRRPVSYLGVDLSPQAIAWCRQHYQEQSLGFAEGSASALPVPDDSVDVVLNVESSHCYPSMPDFLCEVRRVLKPEGRFSFCDLRSVKGWEQTRRQFNEAGLTIIEEECISEAVLRALDQVASHRAARIEAKVPPLWRRLFRDFTGVRSAGLYQMLKERRLKYMRVLAGG